MARRLITDDALPDYGITIGNDQRKNLEREGRFPRRVKVTARSHAYVESEIIAYAEARIAARDEQAA